MQSYEENYYKLNRNHAGDEVLAELMDRVGAPYGPDPSDPWVASEVSATSGRRLRDAEDIRRAVGDAIMAEETVPVMAATRAGLDAAINAKFYATLYTKLHTSFNTKLFAIP